MDEHGLETLAAVDENGSLIGVIDRDRLLDELLAKSLLGIE
jgi:Mg/Co/Ni transporter MgtE